MSSDIVIYPPESRPLGLSYEDWCIKWCQWITSIPKQSNPTVNNSKSWILQKDGNAKVVFLCQTYESATSIPKRHISVPTGSNIFMPIINWISVLGGNEKNTMDLKKLAEKMIDEVVKLQLIINGSPIKADLWDFRVKTPAFDIVLPNNNIFGVSGGRTSMVVDGFWMFFQPLQDRLSIETFGACRSGITRIAVNYELKFVSVDG